MAYTFRHPDDGDIWRVYGVMREVALADEGEFDFTEDDMEVVWRMRRRENAWLVEDENGSAVAFGAIHERHPTRLRTISGVIPGHRGNGVGSQLLQRLEKRARELARKAPAGEPVWLSVSAGQHNVDAPPLFERHGFEFTRVFLKMAIDLDEAGGEPAIPEGIVFEPLRAGTERAVFDASEEAFRDHWDHVPHDYGEWRAWMLDREDSDPSVWVIAWDGDEIAGGSLNAVEDGDAWVGVLFVRRPWRRRGLGSALLKASFDEFRKRGVKRALLGVDAENPTGATRLYEQAGMRVAHEERLYRKDVRVEPEAYE
jgi:mycothiol synthase